MARRMVWRAVETPQEVRRDVKAETLEDALACWVQAQEGSKPMWAEIRAVWFHELLDTVRAGFCPRRWCWQGKDA